MTIHKNHTHSPTMPSLSTRESQGVANQRHSPNIGIASWNCHGLSHAIPYLQHLSETEDIIVLAEHWLWPFELPKLDSIVPGFQGIGISNTKLNELSNLRRGCGGVGIIWRSSIPVSNVVSTNSDRIIAVQFSISNGNCLSVVGVYLPTSDTPISCYR